MVKKHIQLTTSSLNTLLNQKEAIDFRLDEPSWKDLDVGDIVQFWEDFSGWDKEPSKNSRLARVRITEIFRAKSFSDLIDALPHSFILDGQSKDDIIKNLRQWWTPEKEMKNGVLGWKVQLLR